MADRNIDLSRKPVLRMLWLLLTAVFFLHYVRRLVAEPTFFDGQIYASIARNMADGVGSIWRPQFSATMFPLFAEHPPLAFWLQAPLYRFLGDGIWIEKSYSLAMLLISAGLLFGIWRKVTTSLPELQGAAAIPLLLALIAGRLAWAFSNNMLENTLIVFTSTAIFLVTVAYHRPRPWVARSSLMLGAGLCTVLALMTKGPVGLFPVASCGIYWLVFRRPGFWTAVLDSLLMIAVICTVLFGLWHMAEPHAYIQRYLDQQLLASLSGARGRPDGIFSGLTTLLRLNAYPFILALVLVLIGRYKAIKAPVIETGAGRVGLFFLLTAVSASLPLMVSPRLHTFYFNPSLAYYAAAMAVWCVPYALLLVRRLQEVGAGRVRIGITAIVILSVAIAALNIGNRDEDSRLIEASHKIASLVCGQGEVCRGRIATCTSVWQNWQLESYMQRYYGISIENIEEQPATSSYLLVDDSCSPKLSDGLKAVDLDIPDFRVFQR